MLIRGSRKPSVLSQRHGRVRPGDREAIDAQDVEGGQNPPSPVASTPPVVDGARAPVPPPLPRVVERTPPRIARVGLSSTLLRTLGAIWGALGRLYWRSRPEVQRVARKCAPKSAPRART